MDKKIAVVTGAARGMGFAAAKKLCEKYYVILTDVNRENLDNAVAELKAAGFDCEGRLVDVTDRTAVAEVAQYAASLGDVQAAVNIAGLSPSMAVGRVVWNVNYGGAVNMSEEFTRVMKEGACILNFSSMSGDLIPNMQLLRTVYNLQARNKDLFEKMILGLVDAFPDSFSGAIGYVLSKNFVNYYAELYSRKLAGTGIRIITISPGDFETPMGMLEKDGAATYLPNASIKRFGSPDEMAFLVDALVDERNSYMTGVEVLNDGGVIASVHTSFPYFIRSSLSAAVNQYGLGEKFPILKKFAI